MNSLSVGMMLIKFNGITDANIRMYANNTNKEIDTESNWISVFIRIISIKLVYWHRFDSFLYRYYLLNYRQHVGL